MRSIPILVLLAGCSGSSGTMTIAPYRVPCVGVSVTSCLEVTERNGTPELFYDSIEGFTFRWGETREVTYTTHEVEEPLADGSSLRYEALDDVIVATSAPTDQFSLSFRQAPEPWFVALGPGRVGFAGEPIVCDPNLCDALVARTDAFDVRFEFAAPAGAVATALAIE